MDFGQLLSRRWGEAHTALGLPPGTLGLSWDIGPYPHFKTKRGYAVCFHKGPQSCHLRFAEKTLRAPVHRADGLARHEMGHAIDFCCDADALDAWGLSRGVKIPRTPERRADAIAEAVWGDPIRYDSDLVQSTKNGVYPRPRHLGL